MNTRIALHRVADRPGMIVANHGPIHRIRKIFETRDVGIFHSEIAPGSQLPFEVHKFIEVVYRIKGETITVVDGKEYFSGPGSYLVVPAGQWHQTRVLETEQPISQIILATYDQVTGSLLSLVQSMLLREGAEGAAAPRPALAGLTLAGP
jgi:quercetin dioxygenase-like cupin family protein